MNDECVVYAHTQSSTQMSSLAGQRIHQQLNEKEKGFLDTLYKLLTSAHFELLTEAEWAAATKEEFQVEWATRVATW